MGEFSDSPKWRLVNDFTIHEDQTLSSGRPFMRTRVPKGLDVEVTSFEVIRFVEWPSSYGDDKRPDTYADRTYIKFDADLHDRIVVFTMENGEVATFRKLTDATIRALPAGQIGGKHKATSSDGIGYSGMSSEEVPAEGLMEGEPGALSYLAEFEEREGGSKTPASLTASLFLDEDKFARLLAALSLTPRPVATLRLHVLAELFESEVSASLSEPWMSRHYGFLSKGSVVANTHARIESISLSTGPTKLVSDDPSSGEDSAIDRMLGIDDGDRGKLAQVPLQDRSKAILRYQRYIFIALVVLILVTFFSN